MDFDSLSCPSLPAAPVSSHSNISEVPKNHKIAGDGGKPLQLWEMPSGIVYLSRDAAPLNPQGWGHHRQALSCSSAPNPELWMVNWNWSCLFQLDPGALALLAPSPWLPAAAVGAELPVVLLHPTPAALPTS